MLHLYFLLIILMAVITPLEARRSCAYESRVQVRLLQNSFDASPGQVLALQALVTNPTSDQMILLGHLDLPGEWKATPGNDLFIHTERGQTIMQTLFIRIPEHVQEDIYTITYEIWDRDNFNIQDRSSALVKIYQSSHLQPSCCPPQSTVDMPAKAAAVPPTLKEDIEDSSLRITSPRLIHANQGEIIFVSALLHNESEEPMSQIIHVQAPDHWLIVPGMTDDTPLLKGESTLRIFGVKVSDLALAGVYELTIASDHSRDQSNVIVQVASKIDFAAELENTKGLLSSERPVELTLNCMNRGNIPLRVHLEASGDPACTIEYLQKPFEIEAQDSLKIPLLIIPHLEPEASKQFVLLKITDSDTGEVIYRHTSCLEFVRPGIHRDDACIRIPSTLSLTALGDRGKKVLAIECAGKGYVDTDEKYYLEYLLRQPTETRNVIYNVDQQFFLGVRGSNWNLKLGDTSYELTPLTQRFRYGRGLGFELFDDHWGIGAHYTQNTFNNSYNPHEMCGYVSLTPIQSLTISGNILHKTLIKTPSSTICSLAIEGEYPEKVYTECEFGYDSVKHCKRYSNLAYRFQSKGLCFSKAWFDVEKIYAGSSFYGYYQNMDSFSSTLDFPVGQRMRTNISVNFLKQNFTNTEEEGETEKIGERNYPVLLRQRQCNATLTYNLTNSNTLTINSLLLRARDAGMGCQYDFFQQWGGLSLSLTLNRLCLNLMSSWGHQKSYLRSHPSTFLQKYYVFLSKNISHRCSASLFYEGGNRNLYNARHWTTSFGGSLNYSYRPNSTFNLYLQKVKDKPDMYELSQVSLSLNHTFNNLHRFQALVQYFHYHTHYPNDFMFLVNYTIPFGLPVGKRQDIGSLQGHVFDSITNTPIPQAIIQLNTGQTVTDQHGKFVFRNVPKGEYTLHAEILSNELITQELQPMPVKIESGNKNDIVIQATKACAIKGEIVLYKLKDSLDHWKALMQGANEGETVKHRAMEGIRITIERDSGKESYTSLSERDGRFLFPKLRPGQWRVFIETANLPALHDLNENDLTLDLTAGEERELLFKVLPKTPTLHLFE